jgi:hypothetical protein
MIDFLIWFIPCVIGWYTIGGWIGSVIRMLIDSGKNTNNNENKKQDK